MKADLHVHSTASDGTLDPTALVELAVKNGVDVLAIADHDSVEGLDKALAASARGTITLVPAVELSSTLSSRDIHVLGYFIDHHSATLREQLALLKDARRTRAEAMVASLQGGGFRIHMDDVLRISDGAAIGRSHIARAMLDLGHVESVRQAFVDHLGHGRPYYVSKAARTPAEAISLIHEAGGVAVVAHPGIGHLETLIDELIESGLDGIEAYHADHTPEQVTYFAQLAAENHLLVTGGTDYHGPQASNPELGSVDVPDEAIAALLALGQISR